MKNTLIKLTRLESNHNNLRTSEIYGYLQTTLVVGEEIMITAKPLDASFDVRCIHTTPILEIDGNIYRTKNSVYRIEFVEELCDNHEGFK